MLLSGRPLAKPSSRFAVDHCSRAVDRSRSHPRGLQSITARERSTAREAILAVCSGSLPASGRPLTKPSWRCTVTHCPRAVDRSRSLPGRLQSITARERSTSHQAIPAVHSQSLPASGRPLTTPSRRFTVNHCPRAVDRSRTHPSGVRAVDRSRTHADSLQSITARERSTAPDALFAVCSQVLLTSGQPLQSSIHNNYSVSPRSLPSKVLLWTGSHQHRPHLLPGFLAHCMLTS